MRISSNISAIVSNNNLKSNETKLSESIERLSSGLKINHAYDDAAGMAISNKMKAQIKGLNQASRNSSDGISVIETAESALSEVQNIIQRMRELAVQAGNDTNADEDRDAIQEEIDELTKEVDRISTSTEFNKKSLLDGSLGRRTYTDNYDVRIREISSEVTANKYEISVEQDARQAVFTAATGGSIAETYSYTDEAGVLHTETFDLIDPATKTIVAATGNENESGYNPGTEGTISINGVDVQVKANDTATDVYEKIRDACSKADVACIVADVDASGNYTMDATKIDTAGYVESASDFEFGSSSQSLVFISKEYGAAVQMDISCDNVYLAQMIGIGAFAGTYTDPVSGSDVTVPDVTSISVHGTDAKADISDTSNFNASATMSVDGNKMLVTDRFGFSMEIETTAGVAATSFTDVSLNGYLFGTTQSEVKNSTASTVNLEVTDIGTMTLHVGANKDQVIDVDIPDMSAESLGIDDINVRSSVGVDKALTRLDKALSRVSDVRARMGACENRLEYAISSTDATAEKMTAALSRIEDVDMAAEMTEFSQYNVLTQAATSVLAQANDLPQQVLQLLS